MTSPRQEEWTTRRLGAWCVRALVFVVPIAASLGVGVLAARSIPRSSTVLGQAAWILSVVAGSTAVFVGFDRIARRALPLVTLLRLSLVFPDRAPSRFAIALRAGSPKRLQAWLVAETERGEATELGRQAEAVLSMVSALGQHDRKTRGHSERVQALTALLASELRLGKSATQRLLWAALLHDIGKLSVDAEILNHPGQLDDVAMGIMRRHPEEGIRLAEPLASWLGEWRHGIDQHHEKYDGTGYPARLAGHDISLAGRIVSVTDAYETMTAVRSYKSAMSVADARTELTRCAGTHFDPVIVRAFVAVSLPRWGWRGGAITSLAELPFLWALPRTVVAAIAVGSLAAPNIPPHGVGSSSPPSESTAGPGPAAPPPRLPPTAPDVPARDGFETRPSDDSVVQALTWLPSLPAVPSVGALAGLGKILDEPTTRDVLAPLQR